MPSGPEAEAGEASALYHGAEDSRKKVAAVCSGVKWRATVDEDGQYSFAVAL